jgi:hypothetical protein
MLQFIETVEALIVRSKMVSWNGLALYFLLGHWGKC